MGHAGSLDPWHLWGTSATLIRQNNDSSLVPYQQLVNIDAKYPIAWVFFLSATFSWLPPNPGTMGAQVNFDLQLGVGRSNVRIAPFHQFVFTDPELTASGGAPITKWTTTVMPPDPSFPPPAGPEPRPVEKIVAQSLQVQANMLITGITGVNTVQTAEVTAYFAPLAHVRPEWFAGKFGSELGGK